MQVKCVYLQAFCLEFFFTFSRIEGVFLLDSMSSVVAERNHA
jgi:hypothetical protein